MFFHLSPSRRSLLAGILASSVIASCAIGWAEDGDSIAWESTPVQTVEVSEAQSRRPEDRSSAAGLSSNQGPRVAPEAIENHLSGATSQRILRPAAEPATERRSAIASDEVQGVYPRQELSRRATVFAGETWNDSNADNSAVISPEEYRLARANPVTRPPQKRGPDLLPVDLTVLDDPAVTLDAPEELSQPARAIPQAERSTIAPLSTVSDGSNDFPVAAKPGPTERAVTPQQPFRFASSTTRVTPQNLPPLPPLPGKVGKQKSNDFPAASPATARKKAKAPGVLASADSYVLASQPQAGDHWKDDTPQVDDRAWRSETYAEDFSPDAIDSAMPYQPWSEMQIYEGKTLNSNQRPLVELGRPWYQLGQLSPGSSLLGFHNNVAPQFLIFGDFRTAIASNQLGGNSTTRTASELNLDFDLKLTGTERFHMFVSPLDDGVNNTGYLFDEDRFDDHFDAQIDFGYFEGDLGAIVGGAIGKTLPFDLPYAIGEIPLLLQNGVWMEDAFLGFAATIPARNSPRFDISNMDVTFFAGFDQINSPAFAGDNSAAKMYGVASFVEAMNGYWEIDYAFLEDRTFDDRSYHNIGIGFTRRYGRLVSNSTRVIVNAGQSTAAGVENTADGVLLLSENSLITGAPSAVVPYLNFFAGFDRPQSAARAGVAGGVLRNTGILFESDGMTGYPTLDPTANDTFGMALGVNILPNDFSQQLVVEAAMLGVMGEDANRNAQGDQYGLGVRYQLPLTNAIIFRSDAMVGFRRNAEDINGVRMELRHKF